jgi:hypothetical protein
MPVRCVALFAVFGALAAGGIAAHHSAAMSFDLSREIEVSGVVTEYELGNPHLRIYFDVDNAGSIEKWMAEGGSRTVLMRKGWDGTEFSPGDRVHVRGHPSRDGSNAVHMEYVTLPDGSERFAEDLDSAALDQRRRRE